KSGHIHGATDELGHRSVVDKVSVLDLLSTILHQVGLDQNQLSYRHNNIEETLTDAKVTQARVVGELLSQAPTVV
ncbi:MAG: DUF1501 domain-containing protein, partial [Fuerstiella sp.]|nr:DUF1501 domain-containing protein [Fuerstiella sp.]